jgi:endonuclease III
MTDRERLIQEDYIDTEHGPWKILVICQCLNMATWMVAEEVVKELFEKYPNPTAMAKAFPDELFAMVKRLGFATKKTDNLIMMSKQYLIEEEVNGNKFALYRVRDMDGCGSYAADAWDLFVLKRACDPKDKQLRRYAEKLGAVR